jgi:hypothetical protein
LLLFITFIGKDSPPLKDCTIAGSDRSQKQIVEEASAINKQHFDDSSDSIQAMTKPVPEQTKT